MTTKKTETKPKTVTARILVVVNAKGEVCASNEDCGNFYKPGHYADKDLIGALVHDNGFAESEVTMRFINVELPLPNDAAAVKTLTIKDV